jgi:hypothetical protein
VSTEPGAAQFDLLRLREILEGAAIPKDKIGSIVDFLIYYGFLGIKVAAENVRYIFDVGYDMKLLKTLISKHERTVSYVLNPAFFPALNL